MGESSEDPKQEFIIICGASGSGKSTLAKDLLASFKGKVCAVNSGEKVDKRWERVSWGCLSELSDVALVVDDLINPTPAQMNELQEVINVSAHHKTVRPILVLVHSLIKNNCQSLLSYADTVYITGSKNSYQSLKRTFNYFNFEKERQAEYSSEFLGCGEPFCYFKVSSGDRSMVKYRSEFGASKSHEKDEKSEKISKLKTNAYRMIEFLPRTSISRLLFDLILPVLPLQNLDENSITLTMSTRAESKIIKINLLDYLFALGSENCVLTKDVKGFHNWLVKRIALPKCFVENPQLKKECP